MNGLLIHEKQDELRNKLNVIHESLYETFYQAVTWWYMGRDSWNQRIYGFPNIDDLLEDENRNPYLEMIFSMVAETICINEKYYEQYPEIDVQVDVSMEIISSNYEEFAKEVRSDIKKVLDSFQMVYGEGHVVVGSLSKSGTHFEDEFIFNSPIQEVW